MTLDQALEIHRLAQQIAPTAHSAEREHAQSRLIAGWTDIEPAALALLEAGRTDSALDLIGALSAFWQDGGRVNDGRRITESIVRSAGERRTREAARAQLVLGELAFRQGDQAVAGEATRTALAIATSAGDTWVAARSELNLARIAFRDQDAPRILHHASRVRELAGDDRRLASGAVHMLGWAAYTAGDMAGAIAHFERNVELCRAAGNAVGEAGELGNLGDLAAEMGDLDRAADYLRRAFAVPGASDSRYMLPSLVRSVATLAALRGDPARAVQLFMASDRLYADAGLLPDPGDANGARLREEAVAALGPERSAEVMAPVADWSPEQTAEAAKESLGTMDRL